MDVNVETIEMKLYWLPHNGIAGAHKDEVWLQPSQVFIRGSLRQRLLLLRGSEQFKGKIALT